MRERKKREIKRPTRATPAKEAQHHLEEGVITGHFDCDYQALMQALADCADLKVKVVHTTDGRRVGVFFFSGLVNAGVLSENIIRPIQAWSGIITSDKLEQHIINVPETVTERKLDLVGSNLADGVVAIIADGVPCAVMANILQYNHRGVERSQSEDVIIGPHYSFSEALGENVALLRRRMSTPRFKTKTVDLGRMSRTKVAMLYLEGVAQEKLVAEVEERLTRVDIDYVAGASYLRGFLEDEPSSVFPQLRVTERPSRVIAALSEGRVVVMSEGDPTALIAPTFLPEFLQSSEDYFEKPLAATFLRHLRLLSAAISVMLPGLWISLVVFHHGIIPPPLFNAIVGGREGVPLPSVLEAFMLLLAFDIVIEASTRLPAAIGPAIGIVGAIILGQSAVQASLVSPTMTIVVALSGLAAYTQPSPGLLRPIRILKYFVLVLSSIFGLFGLVWAVIYLTIQAVSIRSFGYPFMYPLAPFNLRGEMDILLKQPNFALNQRPHFLAPENERRLAKGATPKPGKGEPNET